MISREELIEEAGPRGRPKDWAISAEESRALAAESMQRIADENRLLRARVEEMAAEKEKWRVRCAEETTAWADTVAELREAEGRASVYRTERDHYSRASEEIKASLLRAQEAIEAVRRARMFRVGLHAYGDNYAREVRDILSAYDNAPITKNGHRRLEEQGV